MTPTVKRILDQCKALGIVVLPTPDGQYLDLRYNDPPPEDLRQMLRDHKQEILSLLKPQPPLWHAQEIARAVQKEGVCLFWSDVLQEVIAFAKDDKQSVPAGFVTYTSAELKELHKGEATIAPQTLRMIHAAKKAGGKISKDVLEC